MKSKRLIEDEWLSWCSLVQIVNALIFLSQKLSKFSTSESALAKSGCHVQNHFRHNHETQIVETNQTNSSNTRCLAKIITRSLTPYTQLVN